MRNDGVPIEGIPLHQVYRCPTGILAVVDVGANVSADWTSVDKVAPFLKEA